MLNCGWVMRTAAHAELFKRKSKDHEHAEFSAHVVKASVQMVTRDALNEMQ